MEDYKWAFESDFVPFSEARGRCAVARALVFLVSDFLASRERVQWTLDNAIKTSEMWSPTDHVALYEYSQYPRCMGAMAVDVESPKPAGLFGNKTKMVRSKALHVP